MSASHRIWHPTGVLQSFISRANLSSVWGYYCGIHEGGGRDLRKSAWTFKIGRLRAKGKILGGNELKFLCLLCYKQPSPQSCATDVSRKLSLAYLPCLSTMERSSTPFVLCVLEYYNIIVVSKGTLHIPVLLGRDTCLEEKSYIVYEILFDVDTIFSVLLFEWK